MARVWFSRSSVLSAAVLAAALGLAGLGAGQIATLPAYPASDTTPTGLLTWPVPDTTPNAALVRRGQALVIAGDCMSCHWNPGDGRQGGAPLAGGLGLNTPFGVIYSPNITSDTATGVGAWTNDEFYRAMHDGIGRNGENLYPAFPYPSFSRISRDDDDAILAFLKTTPAVRYTAPANRLPFPLNIRFLVKGWNLLFFRPRPFQANATQSAEWNRGAYLVTGPGHCGACHTPKNALGADQSGRDLRGGTLDNWTARTSPSRPGLGSAPGASTTSLNI